MKTIRERYLNDVQFKTLVDVMASQLDRCAYTPSEMREAAIMASILYNERIEPNSMLKHIEISNFIGTPDGSPINEA